VAWLLKFASCTIVIRPSILCLLATVFFSFSLATNGVNSLLAGIRRRQVQTHRFQVAEPETVPSFHCVAVMAEKVFAPLIFSYFPVPPV
jgi:hypothetical protein